MTDLFTNLKTELRELDGTVIAMIEGAAVPLAEGSVIEYAGLTRKVKSVGMDLRARTAVVAITLRPVRSEPVYDQAVAPVAIPREDSGWTTS